MKGSGIHLACNSCGKRWELCETGDLRALDGVTEFERVPDWFLWEREQVKAQIERGEYSFEDDVDVYTQPRCWKFDHIGPAHVTHDEENGFVLTGEFRGEKYFLQRLPIQNNSLHIEYDWVYVKPEDCFDLSTDNDSFYCYPTKPDVITKLAFATEILYERAAQKKITEKAAK